MLYLAPYPTGWDDVDFALALAEYDLLRMQPHFPGYPIYILAAHLFNSWLHDPFLALSLLSGVAGGLTVIPLWLLFHRMGNRWVASLAVWMYSVAPLPLITSIQPMSDSLGAFLAAWLAYFAWRVQESKQIEGSDAFVSGVGNATDRTQFVWPTLAAGVVLGLLLGVRISYLALSALWVWAVAQLLSDRGTSVGFRFSSATVSAVALAAVCGSWLLALVVSAGGVDSFAAVAVSFTEGHFSDWGGAYEANASLWERARLFLFRQIGGAGLGTVWPVDGIFNGVGLWRWVPTAAVVLGIVGLIPRLASDRNHRRPSKTAVFLCIWIIPYLLWAFFAQNVEKPRHILPLLPPLLYLLAAGLWHLAGWAGRLRQPRLYLLVGAFWLSGVMAISYPLLVEARTSESPMMQLARYVKANVSANDSLIFTWEEQRVLRLVSPAHTSIRLRRWEDFRTEVLQYQAKPMKVYATNALINGFNKDVAGLFREVAVFRGNPWLYPTYHTIVLYEGTSLLYENILF
ncbi:hypothetical protein EFBL_0350 [Effusibacillus lacus]|uniref:Glycosyltransferase RgtA/B/C/D-like domain-containing protein n=1 Tax=Effusibacillus lacus TaxID=1348429 RepID=A0A292YI37_9BACL|nr:hypothetical protein EFBL_0350 [Effusibacillus lacus]